MLFLAIGIAVVFAYALLFAIFFSAREDRARSPNGSREED